MRELVGKCSVCQKDIYCLNGFLNGEYNDNHLYCFACASNVEKEWYYKKQSQIIKFVTAFFIHLYLSYFEESGQLRNSMIEDAYYKIDN